MNSNILSTILASSVVAGIVSATVAYFQFHKSNKLVYITNERKEWRSDIRKIAVAIEAAATYDEIRKPLVELKVRINAYGKHTDDVNSDAHIWKVIGQLQNKEGDFEELKQLLILYLSMLLKRDWERSKEEIKGNTYKTVLYLAVLLTEVIYCYTYLVTLKFSVDLLFIGSIIIISLPVIMPERTRMNRDKAIEWFEEDNKYLDGFMKSMSLCILLLGTSVVIECLLSGGWKQIDDFWLSFVLMIGAFIVRYLNEYRRYMLDVYYYQNIALCKKRTLDKSNEEGVK